MSEPRGLLQGLLDYIGEQAKQVSPDAFSLGSSKGFVRRPADLVGLPGVTFDRRVEGDHIWMRVDRLVASAPLPPPELVRNLLKVGKDPDGAPPSINTAEMEAHLASIDGRASAQLVLDRREDLERQAREALANYLPTWETWAAGERPRRKTIALYGELFTLKYQMEAEETAQPRELVWGVGVASARIAWEGKDVEFNYPLLTQSLEIELKEPSMALELRPRATDTRVELDAFVFCQVEGAAGVDRTARDQLAARPEAPVSPFDPGSYGDVLKLCAGNLDPKGRYVEVQATGEGVPVPGEHLVVTDAWVLLSRPRTNNYLFEDLRRLWDRLESGCDLHAGPLALVTPPADEPVEYEAVRFRGLSSRGSGQTGGDAEELYFPLPYNDEQVTIVQRLERAAGVAVQGPPGTGKTHTIANIICHYLATGRRVLVTSRGEPALAVLQRQIPEDVRPLTVALLTSDREGISQFRGSIEAIQHQVSQLSPELTRHAIQTLRGGIDRAHAELSRIDTRIDEIATAQLADVMVDGQGLRAQQLAEQVVRGSKEHAWFDDTLTLAPENAPPCGESDMANLREARRSLGKDLVYATARVPSVNDVLPLERLVTLHETLSRMRRIEREVDKGQLLALRVNTPAVLDESRKLLDRVSDAQAIVSELEGVGSSWPSDLRVRCRLPRFASERQALEALSRDIDQLKIARAEFLKRPVELSADALADTNVELAVQRAVRDGKPFSVFSLSGGDSKARVRAIRVAGLPPANGDDWAHVGRYLALHREVVSFLSRWNAFAETLGVPTLKGSVESLRDIEQTALAARHACRLAREFDPQLQALAERVFEQPPIADLHGNAAALGRVREQLQRHLAHAELALAAAELAVLQEKLAGCTGPVSDMLRAFIATKLGSPEVPAERAGAGYAEIQAELRRVAGLASPLATINETASLLEQAGAAKLAMRVRTIPVANSGEDTVLPSRWRLAWNWARMRDQLERIESRAELQTLSNRRRDLEEGLSRLYRDIVAKAAWLATKKNATPKVLQALAGYATAIRRIGQGTGPNAIRYRRDARQAMFDAAGAVPCWIMSHARVSESMPADIGTFDLVIVDEASQSDLWAMPAILRGKKILVVGDDKQVSPDGGFISSQHIQQLRARFLEGQPYGVEMTPEKSLYDLASRVFAAEQVMLREHFRCVPAIIAYSNNAFYKGQIHPLRIAKGSERLDPPLVEIYVPDGRRDSHDRNQDEAEAIAAEIEAILADELFRGRSIGVVSLLGMEQAKHIDSVVRSRCDAAELVHRRFLSGDARTFQGSERDIMFLSMVVDPQNCKALSGTGFEQRFNVAASRARDRMYLVRSIDAKHLSDKDLRRGLLEHFSKPRVTDTPENEVLIERCESGFERDVFGTLVARGYQVIPQVKSGAFRIDMVVEGAGDLRLAIECDGDEYHGPDRWSQDMSRQRVLERAGWTFWRCFASTWALRREEVMAELVGRLSAMGIEPLGALESAPALVERRTWSTQAVASDDSVQRAVEAAIAKAQQV